MTIQLVWTKVPLTCFHWDPINILENFFWEILFFSNQNRSPKFEILPPGRVFWQLLHFSRLLLSQFFAPCKNYVTCWKRSLGQLETSSHTDFGTASDFSLFFDTAEVKFHQKQHFLEYFHPKSTTLSRLRTENTLWIATHLVTSLGNIPYKLWHFWRVKTNFFDVFSWIDFRLQRAFKWNFVRTSQTFWVSGCSPKIRVAKSLLWCVGTFHASYSVFEWCKKCFQNFLTWFGASKTVCFDCFSHKNFENI